MGCLLSGSVTCTNVRNRPRPRSQPASISVGSIRSRPANSTRIRYGMYPYTRPRMTVTELPPSQLTGEIPTQPSALLT